MPSSSLVIILMAVSIVISLAMFRLAFVLNRDPALTIVKLGRHGKAAASLDERAILVRQHELAFRLVLASGIVALLLLVATFVITFVDTYNGVPLDVPAKLIGLVCGLGDSALFAYFLKVWRSSGENLGLKTSSTRR